MRNDCNKFITTWMGDDIEARKNYITQNANFNKIDNFIDFLVCTNNFFTIICLLFILYNYHIL